MQYNGVEISAAQEKAELFNNYFNSVFKRDDCIPLHEDYFFSDFDNDNQSLSNITISPSMVREFLNQLNTPKSCGPDKITSRLLKECSWNNHIDIIIIKANKMLSVIKRTCTNECDQKSLIILYKSLVWSQLEYASQLWSPYTKEKITALELVQRCATKFILKTDLSNPERLVALKLSPLEYKRDIGSLFFSLRNWKVIDFNVLSYANFMTTSEATLVKGLFKTDVFRCATKFILKTDLSNPKRLVALKLLPLEYKRDIGSLFFL